MPPCTFASMEARLLLALLLLPALAHADALSAYGMGLFFSTLLTLLVTLPVVIGLLIMMYERPQWPGLPYVVGLPLLVLTWVRLASSDQDGYLTLLLLLALLLNGLVWGRRFRPQPVRIAGALAILIGSVGIVCTLLDVPGQPSSYEAAYTAEPAPPAEPPAVLAAGDEVYTYVEDMPKMADIKALIEQRLVLPLKTPREHVFVSFLVTKEGVVRHPQIVKGLRADVDSAVVAAVRRLPDLLPSTHNGQPVNVSFTIAVSVGMKHPN